MNRYYLDTSIWLDYYEKRDKNGEIALKLITRLIDKDEIIIYSDLHFLELKGLNYSLSAIRIIFRLPKPNNIKVVHTNRAQIMEARIIKNSRNMPYRDILHAIIARDNEAILICTDKHFESLKDIAIIKKPIDLV